MIRGNIFMREALRRRYPLPGVEDEHTLQEIEG